MHAGTKLDLKLSDDSDSRQGLWMFPNMHQAPIKRKVYLSIYEFFKFYGADQSIISFNVLCLYKGLFVKIGTSSALCCTITGFICHLGLIFSQGGV